MTKDYNRTSVVVGLGNIGQEYERTRHNAGFVVVEALAKLLKAQSAGNESGEFVNKTNLLSEIATFHSPSGKIILVKPQTFMNRSGEAVGNVWRFFQEATDKDFTKLFVIHDDLDLEFGSFKIQLGTGPKIHNGLLSIEQYLHTGEYWHIRIGVDGRAGDRSMPGSSYVLKTLTTEERQQLDEIANSVASEIIKKIYERAN